MAKRKQERDRSIAAHWAIPMPPAIRAGLTDVELARIADVSSFEADDFAVYFFPGWTVVEPGEHVGLGTSKQIVSQVKRARRCYCSACRNPENWGGVDVAGTKAAHEVVRLRMLVAKANKIPITGKPHHEAKIDAALEET